MRKSISLTLGIILLTVLTGCDYYGMMETALTDTQPQICRECGAPIILDLHDGICYDCIRP